MTHTILTLYNLNKSVYLVITSVFRELDVFKLSIDHSCSLELRGRLSDLGVSRRHVEDWLLMMTNKNMYN